MRVLIAVTCMAVLAAIGHYFWSDYRDSQVAEQKRQILASQVAAQQSYDAKRAECEPDMKRHIQAKTYRDLLTPARREACATYFTQRDIDNWRRDMR